MYCPPVGATILTVGGVSAGRVGAHGVHGGFGRRGYQGNHAMVEDATKNGHR